MLCSARLCAAVIIFDSFEVMTVPVRGKKHLNSHSRKRRTIWLTEQTRVKHNENVTADNAQFVREVIVTRYGRPDLGIATGSTHTSPLKVEPIEPRQAWSPKFLRMEVIAKEIGEYPMWLQDGTDVHTTLL